MVADRGVGKRFPRIGVLFGLVITLIKESWSCFFFFLPTTMAHISGFLFISWQSLSAQLHRAD